MPVLTLNFIESTIVSFLKRSEAIQMAGGIPVSAVVDGTPIPDGWILDIATDFYIPANLHLEHL